MARPNIAEINQKKAAERQAETAKVKASLTKALEHVAASVDKFPNKADRTTAQRIHTALDKFINAEK